MSIRNSSSHCRMTWKGPRQYESSDYIKENFLEDAGGATIATPPGADFRH